MMMTALQACIEARSIPEPNTGCWLWTLHCHHDGYGRLNSRAAHRKSFEAFRGPIPSGMCVLHRCDTPPCVNPAHLFLGTHLDNMRDCSAKGRHARYFGKRRGEGNPNAVLTESKARDIYAEAKAGTPRRDIARRFGVDAWTVGAIARGARWGHIQ